MKDHTFDARNDEMRARQQRGATAQERQNAASRPLRTPNPVPRAETTDAAALADATDLAIGATSPAPRAKKGAKKNANDVTAKDTKRVPATQETQPPDAPKPAKKKAAKTIEAAIAAEKVAAPTKPARADWLDTGLERTGKLTVDELARAWIAHLEESGKTTASTIASYANDLKAAIAFFGADSPVAGINAAYLAEFNISDGVMKLRSGAPKAQPTILKMRRAFRMALEWAREHGVDKG